MQELSRTEKRYKAFLEETKVIPLEKKYKTQYIRTKEAPKIDKDIISEVKYDRVTGEFCYSKKAEDNYYDYGATIKKYLKENFSKEGQGIFLPIYDSVLSMYGIRDAILKQHLVSDNQIRILELLLKHNLILSSYKDAVNHMIKAYKVLNNIPLNLDPKYLSP